LGGVGMQGVVPNANLGDEDVVVGGGLEERIAFGVACVNRQRPVRGGKTFAGVLLGPFGRGGEVEDGRANAEVWFHGGKYREKRGKMKDER